MRRKITFGFFWVMLLSTLFGCATSDQNNPNRTMPNMNNTGAMNSNGAGTNRDTVFNGNGGMSNGGNNNTMSNANAASMQDNFWTNAAHGGMAEVELGRLAAQKATNPEVKRFAQMMVADHTKNNEELKAAAAKKGVTLPTGLDSAHQSMMQRLQGLTGAEFDRAYMEGQVDDHEATLQLMEDNTGNADADIKAIATKTAPIVKAHLDMAQSIQGKLK